MKRNNGNPERVSPFSMFNLSPSSDEPTSSNQADRNDSDNEGMDLGKFLAMMMLRDAISEAMSEASNEKEEEKVEDKSADQNSDISEQIAKLAIKGLMTTMEMGRQLEIAQDESLPVSEQTSAKVKCVLLDSLNDSIKQQIVELEAKRAAQATADKAPQESKEDSSDSDSDSDSEAEAFASFMMMMLMKKMLNSDSDNDAEEEDTQDEERRFSM